MTDDATSFITKATLFAVRAHGKQARKYTGDPYFVHLAEVADIVANTPPVKPSARYAGSIEQAAHIAIALLHDTLEDTATTEEDLEHEFGHIITSGVKLCTDAKPTEGFDRAARKAATYARLAPAPWWVKTVKLADLISNTVSIVEHDPKFAKVYLAEKRALLPALEGGSPILWDRCNSILKRHGY